MIQAESIRVRIHDGLRSHERVNMEAAKSFAWHQGRAVTFLCTVVTELTAALAATGNTKHDFSFFGGLKGKWVGLFMLPPLHGKNQSAACIGARFCRSRGAHDAGKNCICV